jgi:hypothetical protein
LFQLSSHITQGHIPSQIARVLGAVRLLTMTKPLGGVRPIAMRETLYQFTSHVLYLQFCNVVATHFFPYQFEIAIKGSCEAIIHDIKCTLDLHPN